MTNRMTAFTRLVAALVLALGLALPAAAADGNSAAIRSVIESQIDAFRQDDGAAAYAFAAPAIRQLFPTVDAFMGMVRGQYQPVYRPRSVTFGTLTEYALRPAADRSSWSARTARRGWRSTPSSASRTEAGRSTELRAPAATTRRPPEPQPSAGMSPARPAGLGRGAEVVVAPGGDRRADVGHQPLVIGEVVPGEQHGAQHLAATSPGGADRRGVVARRRAVALLVERARVLGVAGVLQVELAEAGIGDAVAAGAGRHDAVEHVDAARRPIRRCRPACRRPSGSAARRPAAPARWSPASSASPPAARRPPARRWRSRRSRWPRAPRADSTRSSASSPPWTMPNSALPSGLPKAALLRSAQRSDRRMARSTSARGAGSAHALVELHADVGIEQRLDLQRALRRQRIGRPVDMRLEGDAGLVELAELRQRHHLEAAGIGQDRPRPVAERCAGRRAPRPARRPAAASGDRCCRG